MTITHVTDDIGLAARALRDGGLVAFATETVYGLGVDATNAQAVRRLFEAKGRPTDNPLIVHLGGLDQWSLAAAELNEVAQRLLTAFAPGPLTVVVRKQPAIVDAVTAGLNTVGLRIPNHSQAIQLLRLAGHPIAAPSANRSGRPSCTTWQSVLEDLDGRVDYILKGPDCAIGIESTVVDCTGPVPRELRSGAITFDQLRGVVANLRACQPQTSDQPPTSPGRRHAHYQPSAPVKLLESMSELCELPPAALRDCTLAELIDSASVKSRWPAQAGDQTLGVVGDKCFLLHRRFASISEYMQGFYEFLRESDRLGAALIYVHVPPHNDKSAALRDRQKRAAGYRE
ncbi:MAG: threonylcarbamoyl-AMP synthase [Pirellulaceae bacterium]|nr:threonylcarbamoyl-AMP synthase [Pirellulaceae bacterium]